jgi:MFS family permease
MTMKSLLRRSDVRLLLTGQALSMFGDWMMIIVLGIWTKELTGSNGAAGLVFFVFALAGLVSPVGGLVVDRFAKRPLMIGSHLTLAAVMCLLLFVHDKSDVWLIYVVTALYGLGGDLFAAARSSMLKAMLPDELLGDANGILQSVREGLRIVAPLAGAGIYAATGGATVAIIDSVTFVLSAATLIALRFAEPPAAPKEHHLLREISAGVSHIWRVRVLRELTYGVAATMLVIGFSETLLFALTQAIGRSASFVGVLGSFQGVGAIVGGLTAGMLMRKIGDVRLTGLGVLFFAVGDGLFLIPSLPVILAAITVAGVGIVWAVVALSTAYMRRSPQTMQGRVNAAANMLFSVPQTVSIAAGAALITVVDYRVEVAVMLVGTLIAAVYLLTRRTPEETLELSLAA